MLTDPPILRLDQAPVTSLSPRDQDHSPLRLFADLSRGRHLEQSAGSISVARRFDSARATPKRQTHHTKPLRSKLGGGGGFHLAMNALRPHQLARRARPRPPVLCASCISSVRRALGHIARPGEQAAPLAGYYADLVAHKLAPAHPSPAAVRLRPPSPSPSPSPPSAKDEALAKARIVFGSRLAGPAAAAATGAPAKMVAGVLVPPRPAEPDNCCMSGCVNCVWDAYREDLEEWVAKAGEAGKRLALQRGAADEATTGGKSAAPRARAKAKESSEASELADAGRGADDLMRALPVGIRQFIKTEKMLKMKHADEASRAEA
jgi:hypothetical protein